MRSWRQHGDVLEAEIEAEELQLLNDLTMQLCDVFELVRDGTTHADDPVIARLFPAAYADDEDAAEFRRLTIDDAAEGRLAHQERMLEDVVAAQDAGEPATLRVRVEHGRDWLTGLTDLRLVLHARLLQDPDTTHPDLTPADLDQFRAVLDWLGYVQGSLLQALDEA